MLFDPSAATRLFGRRSRFRAVFGTPEGQRVLRDIFALCSVGRQVAVPQDPHATYFNDGRRTVALSIAGILGMSDSDILRLAGQQEDENHATDPV